MQATTTNSTSQHSSDAPLLDALLIIARLHDRPQSASSLSAGLPLGDEGFTADLFIRAAYQAGFAARLVSRPLKKLEANAFPAVLLLKDGRAWVATDYQPQQGYTLIQPETGDGEIQLSTKELNELYSGQCLLVRPQYRFDRRSSDSIPERPRSWYWHTVWESWGLYTEVLLASLLINLFALATPLFVMNVYDRVVPNQAEETLWVLATGILIVLAFDFLLRGLRGYFIDMAGKRADRYLSGQIFAQVLNTRSHAQPRSAGAFASHLQEFESFRDFFTSATLSTVVDLPFSVLFLLVIWSLGGDLVWIPLIAMPIVLSVSLLIQIPLHRVVTKSLKAGAQKNASLIETLSALETIKAFRAESPSQRRWEQLINEIADYSLKSRWLSALSVNFSIFVQQSSYIAVIVYGVYLIGDGELSMGGLIACTLLSGRALAPLAQIAGLLTRYQQSRAALHSIDYIMQQPVERSREHSYQHIPKLQGSIELKDLHFQYPAQDLTALQGVNLSIKAGERVAIIGRVGSGKSTIARLLLGLYEAQQGALLFDGIDHRQIDPADLRRNIGYVPQDIHLFYGSLRDNVVLGAPYIDDTSLQRAAHISGLEDMVKQHPQGFAMPIGERGEGLSGGQRQSLAIARGLLLDPPILLMDEPSNAMDNSSEEQFRKRLNEHLQPQQTLIIITHRASLLSLVQRIVVMDSGKIIADGPKEQVLQALSAGKIQLSSTQTEASK